MTTGYNIREGSLILAERRVEQEVADAMLRRAQIQRLWREAYEKLYGPLKVAA
jgi:histone H3/H4